jgi:uncharacterized membrane protein YhaH (DUF805 family)
MNWQRLYFSLAGRSCRREYWIGMAGLVGAGIVANLLPLGGGALSLALLYPAAALIAKRLHDFGRSGWLIAVPLIPTLLSGLIAMLAALTIGDQATMGAALAAAGLAALLSSVAMLVGIGFLLWVGTRNGDPSVNAYGHPSLA